MAKYHFEGSRQNLCICFKKENPVFKRGTPAFKKENNLQADEYVAINQWINQSVSESINPRHFNEVHNALQAGWADLADQLG